jgi:release factor glutamine methyltransferase
MELSIAEALVKGADSLRGAGVEGPRREASLLLAHLLGADATFMITHSEDPLSQENVRRFLELVQRRATGEPLQYITGRQAFFNLEFEVNSDVLIPRPETELLVETALGLLKNTDSAPLICEVGTGSGCIVISLLDEVKIARAIGIDLSPAALSVADRNAHWHGVSERLSLVASDCFAALRPVPTFSMIVSNPPYLAEIAVPGLQREVRDHEPRMALAGGPDGLSIVRRLLQQTPSYLVKGGYFLFEIGFDQHEIVRQFINNKIWQVLDFHRDLQGIPRTVALRKN